MSSSISSVMGKGYSVTAKKEEDTPDSDEDIVFGPSTITAHSSGMAAAEPTGICKKSEGSLDIPTHTEYAAISSQSSLYSVHPDTAGQNFIRYCDSISNFLEDDGAQIPAGVIFGIRGLQQMQTTEEMLSAYAAQLRSAMRTNIMELFGKNKTHYVKHNGKQYIYYAEHIHSDGDILLSQILSVGSEKAPEMLKVPLKDVFKWAVEKESS